MHSIGIMHALIAGTASGGSSDKKAYNTLCDVKLLNVNASLHVRKALLIPTAECLIVQPSSQLHTATVGSVQCYRGRHSVRGYSVQPLHHPEAATSRCCIVGLPVYRVPDHH
jgi:hypothetical protein